MYWVQTVFAALILSTGLTAATAHAAEGYDNCTGFIDTVPATIGAQGTWCLRHDLSTAITGGAAITIAVNNVTLDCNGFKIGGLAAGIGTGARGVYANDRLNSTVRNCAVRGFQVGIDLDGVGAGHLVEDNRLDNNTWMGIEVRGDNNRVQRNRVYDTGGSSLGSAWGMHVINADVIDNTVAGVVAAGSAHNAIGISMEGWGIEVRGNQVRGLVPGGTGVTRGLVNNFGTANFTGNVVTSIVAIPGVGIATKTGLPKAVCRGNTVIGFGTGISADCLDGSGNVVQ